MEIGAIIAQTELSVRTIIKTKSQESNNSNWYRLYSDGWVEQGGLATTNRGENKLITLPITMKDTSYTSLVTTISETIGNAGTWGVHIKSPTQIQIAAINTNCMWVVYGYANTDILK